MYCFTCGAPISGGATFCPSCGKEIRRATQSAPQSEGLRGCSTRINDPAFAKYIKSTNRWAAVFSLFLAVAAVVGFFIAGEMGAEGMSNPTSLYIGLGIGSMFIVIALFQILLKKRSKTWDGTVKDLNVKKNTAERYRQRRLL